MIHGRNSKLILSVFFSGLYANLVQIALLRFFTGNFYGTELHIGLFLAVWLMGIALGGFYGGAGHHAPRTIYLLSALATAASIAGLKTGASFLPLPTGGIMALKPFAAFMTLLVLPQAFLIGMVLPISLRNSERKIGEFYSAEALGSFLGGLIFSGIIAGRASAVAILTSSILLPLISLMIQSPGKKAAGLVCLIWPILAAIFSPGLERIIDEAYWNRIRPGYTLLESFETPYQKLHLGRYHNQYSLFSNGSFQFSWPDRISAETNVHLFVSAVTNPHDILLLGLPQPEWISEFLKYRNLQLTIVELDDRMCEALKDFYPSDPRIHLLNADTRAFLRSSIKRFDGIIIVNSDPMTLVNNRLFTVEAFEDMKRLLKDEGILSLAVTGSENYLGAELEQSLLSIRKTIISVFSGCHAIPGDPIVFWCPANQHNVNFDTAFISQRFADRNIPTSNFRPESFFNIILDFRVHELKSWFDRKVNMPLNTDLHPTTFKRQLLLWDIFSSSQIGVYIRNLDKVKITNILAAIFCGWILLFVHATLANAERGARIIAMAGTALSGAGGLLCEIVFILSYQNRHGAVFQMTGLFFGVYMLGLAMGSLLIGRRPGMFSPGLLTVKVLQSLSLGASYILCGITDLHNAWIISIAIFLTAFLNGAEFPIVDDYLRSKGYSGAISAGYLMFCDNLGAFSAGFLAGPLLLPVIGMQESLLLMFFALLMNALTLKLCINRNLLVSR